MNETKLDFPPIDGFEDTEPMGLDTGRFGFNDVTAQTAKKREEAFSTITRLYPRIARQIELLWGTEDLQHRFTRWLLTDQEGRRGWPPEASEALIELEDQHARIFKIESEPVWGGKPDRW